MLRLAIPLFVLLLFAMAWSPAQKKAARDALRNIRGPGAAAKKAKLLLGHIPFLFYGFLLVAVFFPSFSIPFSSLSLRRSMSGPSGRSGRSSKS